MVHKNKETGRMADSTFKEVFGHTCPMRIKWEQLARRWLPP